jgi:glucosylceramidase
MMPTNSRRAFLTQAGTVTAASLLSPKSLFPKNLSWSRTSGSNSGTRAWITAGEQHFEEMEVQPWQASSSQPGVEIDPSQRFQSILGFGGAFTDASCYLFSRMDAEKRQKLLEEFVGPDGLDMSVGRTCIGASDYSRNVYSFDDTSAPDPDLKEFSIAHDEGYILPTLRDAQQINPEMFLFSTPWSPPGWMKAGGSMLGGSMRNKYFAAYAQYFVKFLEAYRSAGVKIGAVTSQNEVDTDQDGRMPAALWGQEYEIGFIKGFLGPAFEQASLDTKIWTLDHNYNLWGRALDELNDPDVFKYVDGVAWHGYLGDPSAMTRVHNAFPSKHTYWTEGGPDLTDPDYTTGCAKWSCSFAGILRNWARCIVSWNLILDEKGSPNIGPFQCAGVITVDSKTGELTRSGQYWAFKHYSRAVRRGAQVVASNGEFPGVEHVAFVNPDGSYVLVIGNQGEERSLGCHFSGKFLQLKLPQNSALTLVWKDV